MSFQYDELIVDNFAGGGGASSGIELALGRSPDIAINHDPEALAMHEVNHPDTEHFQESVWGIDPEKVCRGKPVGLAWFSPSCTHFSKAKGGVPLDDNIRGLADIVPKWAEIKRPRVIILENVEEFRDWGPLGEDKRPCPERKGLFFRRWLKRLTNLGYQVEMKELRACDYGAPTIRKRLFVIARCDKLPIVWPEPTHGPDALFPYRTAAECIDFSLPCRSIFDRKKPLAEKTLRRIARGVFRYVIGDPEPFVVPPGKGWESPYLAAVPTLIQTGYGERKGQAPRVPGLEKPLGTVVAGGAKHALVVAFLAKHYTGVTGSSLRDPMGTVTTVDHHSLVTAPLIPIEKAEERAEQVRAFLIEHHGTDGNVRLDEPLHTITTRDRFALVTVHGDQYAIADIGMRMLTPRELFRAQGFRDGYIIDPVYKGRPLSGRAQVKMCGNSVSPPLAAALVKANMTGIQTKPFRLKKGVTA